MRSDALLPCGVLSLMVVLVSGFWGQSKVQEVRKTQKRRGNGGTEHPLRIVRHASQISSTDASALVPIRLSRPEGLKVLNNDILPQQQYGERIEFGRDAQGLDGSTLVLGSDPLMAFTYGEFPTTSTDHLIDIALKYLSSTSPPQQMPINFIDLGSGCGRLVFYTALTRGDSRSPWNVHGVEISNILHKVAIETGLKAGLEKGHFVAASAEDGSFGSTAGSRDKNSLSLHLGPANTFPRVLGKADIIFAYSTTWETSGFSEKLGAMMLDEYWNELLAQSCSKGCVVITTDRALDPSYGWELMCLPLEVENREVGGSMGYIQVLR